MREERMNQSNIEEVMGKNFPKQMKPTRSVISANSEKKETKENDTQASLLHSEKQKTKARDKEKFLKVNSKKISSMTSLQK